MERKVPIILYFLFDDQPLIIKKKIDTLIMVKKVITPVLLLVIEEAVGAITHTNT